MTTFRCQQFYDLAYAYGQAVIEYGIDSVMARDIHSLMDEHLHTCEGCYDEEED